MVAQQTTETKYYLSASDRTLVAAIVNASDFPEFVTEGDIVTIRREESTLWVRLTRCWVAFSFDWFKEQVAKLKEQTHQQTKNIVVHNQTETQNIVIDLKISHIGQNTTNGNQYMTCELNGDSENYGLIIELWDFPSHGWLEVSLYEKWAGSTVNQWTCPECELGEILDLAKVAAQIYTAWIDTRLLQRDK